VRLDCSQPKKDWEMLATDILLLLTHDRTWKRMSAARPRSVESLFDRDEQTRQLRELYRVVLNEKALCTPEGILAYRIPASVEVIL